MDTLLVKPEVAASMLAMSRAKLYREMQLGRIPSVTVGGVRRISVRALERLIAAQEEPESPTKASDSKATKVRTRTTRR